MRTTRFGQIISLVIQFKQEIMVVHFITIGIKVQLAILGMIMSESIAIMMELGIRLTTS